MGCASRGAGVDRLADLPHARSLDRAARRAGRQIPILPLQTEELEQSGCLGGGLAYESVVVELEEIGAEDLLPVSHQPPVLTQVMADIHEVVGVADPGIHVQKENRQAV